MLGIMAGMDQKDNPRVWCAHRRLAVARSCWCADDDAIRAVSLRLAAGARSWTYDGGFRALCTNTGPGLWFPRHQGGEGVAGDARSLTPRRSATRISCKQLCGMERHVIQAQRPHHHHHHLPSPPSPPTNTHAHTPHTTHHTPHTTHHTPHTTTPSPPPLSPPLLLPHTHHHHQTFPLKCCYRVACRETEKVTMECYGDLAGRGVGGAPCRRERRLRSWAKHEQLTVAMALATVAHHSFQVGTACDALPSQKLVTSAGCGRLLSSRGGRRCGSSGTPWSRSPTRFRWSHCSSWSSRR